MAALFFTPLSRVKFKVNREKIIKRTLRIKVNKE